MHGHVAERYATNGGCTECVHDKNIKRSVNPRCRDNWLGVDLRVRRILYQCRNSAKGRGISLDLTKDDIVELWNRCGGRCEFSGIEFDSSSVGAELKRPFHPSLDRIDASKGYTKDNCRFVCIAVNIALNTFGDSVLDRICKARAGL